MSSLKTRKRYTNSIDKVLVVKLQKLAEKSSIDQSKLLDMALEELFKLPRFEEYMERIENEMKEEGLKIDGEG